MDALLQTDRYLFSLINNHWHNRIFDITMPFIRNAQTWYPLYLFMLLFVGLNFKTNRGWWLLGLLMTPILTDLISSGLIKNMIYRLRPCNDETMQVRLLLSYKPQSSSFTSSHATNHFGLAGFFYLTLKAHIGKWGLLFFVWAGFICFAQVYVGVHYPLDVICGALIGYITAYSIGQFFNRKKGLS